MHNIRKIKDLDPKCGKIQTLPMIRKTSKIMPIMLVTISVSPSVAVVTSAIHGTQVLIRSSQANDIVFTAFL